MSKGEKKNKIDVRVSNTAEVGYNSQDYVSNLSSDTKKCSAKSACTQTRAVPCKTKSVQTIKPSKSHTTDINISYFKDIFEKNAEIHKRSILIERRRVAVTRVVHIISIKLTSCLISSFRLLCSKNTRRNLAIIRAGCGIIESKLESRLRSALSLLMKNSSEWLRNKLVLNTSVDKFERSHKGRINPILVSFYILSNFVKSKKFYPFHRLLYFNVEGKYRFHSNEKELVAKDIVNRAINNLKFKNPTTNLGKSFNIVSQLEFFTGDRYVKFAT